MSEYQHGDWYCVPANDAEAREIIERAVASGAEMRTQWFPDDHAFGVLDGVVSWDDEIGTKYTLTELRQKFPLPGERVELAGRFKAGDRVEVFLGEFKSDRRNTGETATVLAVAKNSNGRDLAMIQIDDCGNSGECDAVIFDVLRPLRTEREKFIEAAKRIACKDFTESQAMFAAGEIYDALQSGELKAPEVKK